MIYFVYCPNGQAIKVGTSSHLWERLKIIRHQCPFRGPSPCKHEYLGSISGSVGREEELHIRFDNLLIRGEWFQDTTELREAFHQFQIKEVQRFLDEELRLRGILLPDNKSIRREIRLREFPWLSRTNPVKPKCDMDLPRRAILGTTRACDVPIDSTFSGAYAIIVVTRKEVATMDNTQPRLAFSYLRFSCGEQAKGSSVKRQTDLRESYCQRHNLILDESRTYADHGVSGFRGKNLVEGHFSEFLDLVKSGKIPTGSVLLIESIDRFSRDQIIPARNAMEGLLYAGIEIHTLAPEKVYNKESLEDPFALIGMILEFARAHEYSQQLGNRVVAAWNIKREKAKNHGTPLTKHPSFWLRVVDGKYEIIEERAKVVELIYQLCADGMGVKLIAKELTRRRIPAYAGKKWTKSYVGKIITDESAIGHHQAIRRDPVTGTKFLAERIDNLFPPVISETLNAQAKVAMRQRKNKGGRIDIDGKIHPFSGLLKTHTGASLWIKYRKIGRKNPRLVPYLQDQETGNSYPLSEFEQILLEWLIDYEPPPVKKQPNCELAELEEQVSLLDHKIEDLKAEIRSGKDYKSFFELLASAEADKKRSSQRLEELRALQPLEQGFTILEAQLYLIWNIDGLPESEREAAKEQRREALLDVRATLRRILGQVEVTIGQESRSWRQKSLRITVTFRDGTKQEFVHLPKSKAEEDVEQTSTRRRVLF